MGREIAEEPREKIWLQIFFFKTTSWLSDLTALNTQFVTFNHGFAYTASWNLFGSWAFCGPHLKCKAL